MLTATSSISLLVHHVRKVGGIAALKKNLYILYNHVAVVVVCKKYMTLVVDCLRPNSPGPLSDL